MDAQQRREQEMLFRAFLRETLPVRDREEAMIRIAEHFGDADKAIYHASDHPKIAQELGITLDQLQSIIERYAEKAEPRIHPNFRRALKQSVKNPYGWVKNVLTVIGTIVFYAAIIYMCHFVTFLVNEAYKDAGKWPPKPPAPQTQQSHDQGQ